MLLELLKEPFILLALLILTLKLHLKHFLQPNNRKSIHQERSWILRKSSNIFTKRINTNRLQNNSHIFYKKILHLYRKQYGLKVWQQHRLLILFNHNLYIFIPLLFLLLLLLNYFILTFYIYLLIFFHYYISKKRFIILFI
jgi:hypothetical protein